MDSFHTQMKLSSDTFMEEVQSVVLETDDLESQKEPSAYAKSGTLSRSSFR